MQLSKYNIIIKDLDDGSQLVYTSFTGFFVS